MKIIVYNFKDQFALSRAQIENIKSILPNEYFDPILEFHLTWKSPGQERFEYLIESKQAHFCFPTKEKTAIILDEAVTELLFGLARIKSDTHWGRSAHARERMEHQNFVTQWHKTCMENLSKAEHEESPIN